MRINKYLAQAGVASRRKVEEYIVDGKVKVNGKVVRDLATDIKDTVNIWFEESCSIVVGNCFNFTFI